MTTTRLERSVNDAEPHHSVGSRHHRRGFWVVAFAFLVVMALGTVGIAASAIKLLGRTTTHAPAAPAAAASVEYPHHSTFSPHPIPN